MRPIPSHDNENGPADESPPSSYFYDSDGHLYVDVTAVREHDGFEILPVSNGAQEVPLTLTQFRVTKGGRPDLQAVLTAEADDRLKDAICPD